jgi:glycosidase
MLTLGEPWEDRTLASKFKSLAVLLAGAVTLTGCGMLSPIGLGQASDGSLGAQGRRGQVDTPDWAKNAVFYQIFPERFHNGNRANDPKGAVAWGSKPTYDNFMGGDLDGVLQKMPYLKELGVTAIYFNPLFKASSNHKYNTADYMQIDPSFGDLATFKRVLAAAHQNGIKVILDGVFNHTGDDHWAFEDAKKNGQKSKYWNWYSIYGFPVVNSPKPNYNSWWGFGTLPQLRAKENADVQKHLFEVTEYWTRQGIDGWRLDVPNEIDSDEFWRTFRKKVRAINPEAYIVGELWHEADRWLQGDQFDSTMNYVFRENVLNFFAYEKMAVDDLDRNLEHLRKRYHPEVTSVMFNITGSHDVPRILTEAGGDKRKAKLISLFQLTYPGTPVVYYGDEIGMEGGKDPDNRQGFEWNASRQDQDLLGHYKRLIRLRKSSVALRTGEFRSILRHNHHRLFGYVREAGTEKVAVVLNAGHQAQDVALDVNSAFKDGTQLKEAMTGKTFTVQGGKVLVPLASMSGAIFQKI